MSEEGGYDFEHVWNEMEADFRCPTCQLLLKEATSTPCYHAFCKVCLDCWQDEKDER